MESVVDNPRDPVDILILVLLIIVYSCKALLLRANHSLGWALKVNAGLAAVLWIYALAVRYYDVPIIALTLLKIGLIFSCSWLIILFAKLGYTHLRK
jgi:hypothetical protein